MDIAWGVSGAVCCLLVGVGFSVLGFNPPEYVIARVCFWASATILGVTGFVWALKTQQPVLWRVSASAAIWLYIGIGLPETLRWIKVRQLVSEKAANTPSTEHQPTLLAQQQIASIVTPPTHAYTQSPNASKAKATLPSGSSLAGNYKRMSNEDLSNEITRFCASLRVIGRRQEVREQDLNKPMQRAQAGTPEPDDKPIAELREDFFVRSDAFTNEVRREYFPEMNALRAEALSRLHGQNVPDDPNEKRLWDAVVSYLDSPPSPVTGTHLRECAEGLAKMGDRLKTLH